MEAVAAIEGCLTEYYVVVDAVRHRLQGGLAVAPASSAAQAACHVPLVRVLDDCWSLSVNVP